MDIFEHLKKDHRKVADLMNKISTSTDADERVRLFGEVKTELIKHSKAEEATFYNFLDKYEEMEDLIAEAREDHRMVESLIDEIEATPAGSEDWASRFEELKECVEDHVDQEETEIFEDAREIIGGKEADELERRMSQTEQSISPS